MLTAGQKAAVTRKRRAAARKAAATRQQIVAKRKAAGQKAVTTRKHRAAGQKAAATRRRRTGEYARRGAHFHCQTISDRLYRRRNTYRKGSPEWALLNDLYLEWQRLAYRYGKEQSNAAA